MKSRHSIAYKMTRTVVLLTLCLGLAIGTIQVIWDYQQRLDNLNNRVHEVVKSIERSAVKAVYSFDNELAGEVASGLFEFAPVIGVSIYDENNELMTNLNRYKGDLPYQMITQYLFAPQYDYYFPLLSNKVDARNIGALTIKVAPHETVNAFLERAISILTATILQSFVVSIVLLFLFYKRVTRPLQILASDFTKIDPQKPAQSRLELDSSLDQTEFKEVTNACNNLLRVIGAHLNARDTAEQELKRQKNETEQYLKIAEAIILRLDKDGTVIMMNQRGLDLMNYKEHEIVGHDWFELSQKPEAKSIHRQIFDRLFEPSAQNTTQNRTTYYENDLLTKDGQVKHIFWHTAIEYDNKGTPIGVLSSGQDITANKEAEQALRERESKFQTIIEATLEGFAVVDLTTLEMLDTNSALHNLLGYTYEEMIGQPCRDFVSEEDHAILLRHAEAAKADLHQTYELRLKRKDGKVIPVEINSSVLPESLSEKPIAVGFITDITVRKRQEEQRRQLEKQLRQAQKMETIGTLAGGIAHDFNNILTPILGYAALLELKIPPDDPNHERIKKIEKSARRGADMVAQILTFSRNSDGEMKSINLAPVIEEAMELVQNTTPANIQINSDIPEKIAPVIADSTQIQQIIINLCTNANHAMGSKDATMTVKLAEVKVTNKIAAQTTNLKPGPHVKLTISDTGSGMDEDVLTRIYDPFFTTKKSGEGTGLGLSMVHGIVKNHNGSVLAHSQVGVGTTFEIYLPVTSIAPVEEIDNSHMTKGNQELVLIVDDEELNTNFLTELLQTANYRVESFNDSVEAFNAFQTNPVKYQMIITDQSMPHMTGDKLAQKILKIKNDIPIIMISGYDKNIHRENAREFGVSAYLQKPASIDQLTRLMHNLLNQK
ncbi:MAG: PAS domain S-box protein [Methylocystaceae bacterium]|nr:PAS domain S-box protein [Methylocystaceae bacterium]